MIQGYTGQIDMWGNRVAYEPTFLERLDHMFATGDCPDAIVAMVDAWTSFGGSQFLDSSSTGPYLSYLCDEVVPFVDANYPTAAHRDHRGLTGKSSGGYGAMVVPMLRPEVFGALASHAGDALFEACYLPEFPKVARRLRDDFDGSYETFFDRLAEIDHFDYKRFGGPLEAYGYAACYSPDPANPGKALLPFEVETGRLLDEIWAQWLAWDPVRMAPRTRRRAALDEADPPRRRAVRRVLPRPGRRRLRPGGRARRRDVHARALRRRARGPDLPLPGRHPRARRGARALGGRSPRRRGTTPPRRASGRSRRPG